MYRPQPWREDEKVDIDIVPPFRYSLRVQWNTGKLVVVIGLNPSEADGAKDDQTMRQCIDWARKEEGYGALLMLNAYSFRAKIPRDMRAAPDPFGGQTPEKLVELCVGNRVIAAWGCDASYKKRGKAVAAAFAKAGIQLECWDVNTTDGSPRHPSRWTIGKTEPWPKETSIK